MVKRCVWGNCNSDTRYPERLLGSVIFIPFPKPKYKLETCKRWIKACGRPHDVLNVERIDGNYNLYVCSKHFHDGRPSEEHPDPFPAIDPVFMQTSTQNRLPLAMHSEKFKNLHNISSTEKSVVEQSSTMNTVYYSSEPSTSTNTVLVPVHTSLKSALSSPTLAPADSPSPENSQADRHPEDKGILETMESYHSRKASLWALHTWDIWRYNRAFKDEVKMKDISVPYFYEACSMKVEAFDEMLALFVIECKTTGNDAYTPETLQGILFGLQRYLKAFCIKKKIQPFAFIKNKVQFPKYNKAFEKRNELFKEVGVVRKNAQAVGLTPKQEEQLWTDGMFGCNSAKVLSNTIFFYVVKIFGIVSSDALRIMKTDTFVFGENENGKYVELDGNFAQELVMFAKSSCCHNLSLLVPKSKAKLRHYCNQENPRTFYNILNYYIEIIKLVGCKEKALFLTPKEDMIFSANPIRRLVLQQKFASMMKDANVKGYFTTQALVQTCLDNLQVEGYMVRRKQTFLPNQQLQISKVLDPPMGVLKPLNIQTQTKAILRLVNTNQSAQKQPQNNICFDVIHLNHLPGQLTQPTNQPVRMDVQTALQASQNIISAGLNPSSAASYMSTLSFLTTQLSSTSTKVPNTSTISITAPVASTAQNVISTHTVSSENVADVPIKQESPSSINNTDSSSSEEISDIAIETQNQDLQVSANDSNEIKIEYDYDINYIIKQEPEDGESFCEQTGETSNEASEEQQEIAGGLVQTSDSLKDTLGDMVQTLNSKKDISGGLGHISEKIETQHVPVRRSTRKRKSKFDDKINDVKQKKSASVETPTSNTPGIKSSELDNITDTDVIIYKVDDSAESETESDIISEEIPVDQQKPSETNSELVTAELVYSFHNDLTKKISKQEISLAEDGETTFNLSGTTKMGKAMSDLDINLGDYLPKNCLIKPENINISRMILPDGGKMVVKLKYCTGT